MHELKKMIGKVFMSKFVGTGPWSYKKRIYRAAVSQRLRNTAVENPVGKVIWKPTRCSNNSFIDLQDQLNMFRANVCPSSGAQD
jgi:hypothetical protein